MPNEVIIPDDMRRPDERVKVHPFRHPWIKGTDTDPECGRTWHDHGWIDRGDHGFTVCPTQAVRPDVQHVSDVQGEPMTEPITTDGELRAAIAGMLARFDVGPGNVVGHWVLAYTTSGITDAGDFGSNWGYLAHAPLPTIVGLCTLTAADAPREMGDE